MRALRGFHGCQNVLVLEAVVRQLLLQLGNKWPLLPALRHFAILFEVVLDRYQVRYLCVAVGVGARCLQSSERLVPLIVFGSVLDQRGQVDISAHGLAGSFSLCGRSIVLWLTSSRLLAMFQRLSRRLHYHASLTFLEDRGVAVLRRGKGRGVWLASWIHRWSTQLQALAHYRMQLLLGNEYFFDALINNALLALNGMELIVRQRLLVG